MAIAWKEEYETKDEKIDGHHRQLFRFVNKLESLLAQDETVSKREMDQLLGFLEGYIRAHFQYEESCMLKRQCPVAKQNHEAHQEFLVVFDETLATYKSEGFSEKWLRALQEYLQKWLSLHICQVDIQLRHCK